MTELIYIFSSAVRALCELVNELVSIAGRRLSTVFHRMIAASNFVYVSDAVHIEIMWAKEPSQKSLAIIDTGEVFMQLKCLSIFNLNK